jgi:serine protease inhibitor
MPRFTLVPLLAGALLIGGQMNSVSASPSPAAGVVAANTAFALDLYQREKAKTANLFFSPYSISTALAMAYVGARGQTAEEMARALHFNQPLPEVNQGFADLDARFEQIESEKHVQLGVANSLWAQRDYVFRPEYLELSRSDYHVDLRQVDFAAKPDEIRKEINSWVAEKTHDKIEELLQPGQVDSRTRLLLCNAIYFKGNWATQFDPKATRPESFFVHSNQTVSVPMMSRSLSVRHHAYGGFTLFALPYAGDELAMIILLPNAIDGLDAIEQPLNAAALRAWLTTLDSSVPNEAVVTMPKFKLDCRLNLANDLAAMGMPSAFDARADFSGITEKRDLFISGVAHQAYVDVNEQGTEAAAATGVVMRPLSIRQPVILKVDHPFLFLIIEQQTGSVLFLGRITNPAS